MTIKLSHYSLALLACLGLTLSSVACGDSGTDGDGNDEVADTTDATTGPGAMCGWDANSGWYDCGFEGEDPEGTNPIGCPDGLVDGDPCENTGLTDVGCCDANGDNWYCAQGNVVFYNACG